MSTAPLAATSSQALWYLARGSGVVALVLLTLTLVGGIVTSVRWSSERLPRFVTQLLHRNVSLLAFVFICIHIVTVVVDGFAPIGLVDAVVPFRSGYRPLWLGLGAVAFDLLLALIVTSLLRHRIGQRTWRVIHWSSYACWPLVVVHGLGAGSDTRSGLLLVTTAACIVLVVMAVIWRLSTGLPERAGARAAGITAVLVAPLLLGAFVVKGPLASGWAERAGTPASLLGGSSATGAAPAAVTPSAFPAAPFSAGLTGTFSQTRSGGGLVALDVALQMSGDAHGVLELLLRGEPTAEGGVRVESGRAQMGASPDALTYDGEVTAIRGSTIEATVRDLNGQSLQLTADLRNDGPHRVRGELRVDTRSAQSGERGEGARQEGSE